MQRKFFALKEEFGHELKMWAQQNPVSNYASPEVWMQYMAEYAATIYEKQVNGLAQEIESLENRISHRETQDKFVQTIV